MKPFRICNQCRQPTPEDVPEGLCPACLAEAALGDDTIAPGATINVNSLAGQAASGAGPASLGSVRYFGDYELLEEIARGGMGVVYKARQVSLNRIVAVKMILAGNLAGAAEVKRFRAEAEAAAQLQHPNIVAIHEVGEHQGQQYFSMDFVGGTSFTARLRNEPLPIGEAARSMQIIAEAVHFAHQRGILHRDLKPANVLCDELGQPRITDFGLAKRLEHGEQLTASGAILGPPDYMSPEQAAGRHDIIGPAGDVFSLGVMLYQMVTGRVPFRGSNLGETLAHIRQTEPLPPSRLNPRVPPDLETICLKCLEKRPDRRYPTADGLAKDLGRFLNHEAISARPVGRLQRVSRWLIGRPHLLAALASCVLLALVWLAYGLWTENRILAWEHAHPAELKPVSNWSEFEKSVSLLRVFLFFLMLGLVDLMARRLRARVLTGRFVSPRVLNAFGLAGLTAAALSICLGAAEIKGWYWANHSLPRARSELAAELAAEARFKELVELSRKENQKLFQETQEFSRKVIQHSLVAGEGEAETAAINQITAKVNQLSIQEQQALQATHALGGLGASVLKQLQVNELQKEASVAGLAGALALAAGSLWFGVLLILKTFCEHRFAFYPSAEAERTALSQAVLEQQLAATKDSHRVRNYFGLGIGLICVYLWFFPYFYWGPDERTDWKPLFLGEAGTFALALIASLQNWRGSARWHTLNRVLLLLSWLIALVSLLHGPASLVARGIGFGAATGTILGFSIRRAGKN